MTEQLTISEVGFRAMVDFAALPGNERALAGGKITHLEEVVENNIVYALFDRLELQELLERVKYSHYSGTNLTSIAYKVSSERGVKALHELRDHLKATYTEWPSNYGLSEFSKTYWSIVIRDRIGRGDYRRTWDDIRKAAKEEEPFKIGVKQIEQHLRDLYHKMVEKGALPQNGMWCGTHHFRHPTPVHGLSFVFELYPHCLWRFNAVYAGQYPRDLSPGSYEFEYVEAVIMELAKYFARERRVKRGRRAVRQN